MQKNLIVYVSEGSNYALLAVSFSYIVNTITWSYRRRGSQIFFKIDALKNFANLTEKISVFHSLPKKVAGPQAYNFIKRRSKTGSFLWNLLFLKISNSDNLLEDFFQLYPLRTTNIWLPATLTMTNKFKHAFTYQNIVTIECLNINNFAVLLHFWISEIFSKI